MTVEELIKELQAQDSSCDAYIQTAEDELCIPAKKVFYSAAFGPTPEEADGDAVIISTEEP